MSDKETAPRVDNRPCDDCGNENPVWFADNEVWNAAVPERVGYICPNCFIRRADSKIRATGWKLVPEVAAECMAPAPQRGDLIVGRTDDEPHRPLVCYVCAKRFPVTFNFCLEHKDEYERLKAAATPQVTPTPAKTRRQYVYDWMSLPTHRKVEKLQELGLFEEGDYAILGDEQDLVWIKRAKEKGLAEKLLSIEGTLMTLELKAMIRKIETFRTSLPDKLKIMQHFYDAVFSAGMRAGEIARWIPVEEKLPEGAKDVLILYRASARSGLVDSRMAVGWLDGDGCWYGLHGHQSKQSDVTHWQPLPAAPEEKKP